MNKTLEQIFARSVELLKEDSRCLGGWHFGSVSRHMEDEFSDVDPVFLIGDAIFLCENKGITYDDSLERSVKQYIVKNMGSVNL